MFIYIYMHTQYSSAYTHTKSRTYTQRDVRKRPLILRKCVDEFRECQKRPVCITKETYAKETYLKVYT